MTKDAKNLIVGLDIGTSKVVAVVAEVMPDGHHEVIGLGQHESKGLKKGVVVNIEATVKLAQAVRIPIIASGGLHNLADVEALCEVQDEGIEAVICGRSIYEGTLDLQSAQLRADELTEQNS